ncbi:MAG: CDP-alcohol phosphatidyltransferase family protein [bacterium]
MTEAVAVVFYSSDHLRRVAGLALLEREVLALRRGGVARVVVVVPGQERAALEQWLLSSRLAADPPELLFAADDSEGRAWAAAEEGIGSQTPALVLREPVAIDWGFVGGVLEALTEGRVTDGRTAAGGIAICGSGLAGRASGPELDERTFGGAAVAVQSAADGRRARRALLAQSVKPLHIDGIVCYLLIRRLSARLTTLMLPLPITPNLVTGFSVVLGLAAAVAVGVGTYGWTVLGGSLLMLSLIFDSCDGEIARVKYRFSDWGAWFDIYGDLVVNSAFMAGMAVGAYRSFDQPLYLYTGAFAVFAVIFYNATVFRYIHRLGIPDEFLFKWWFDLEAEAAADGAPGAASEGEGPSAVGRFLSGLKYLGRRDFFIFAYLMTAIFGVLHWAFWATVAGASMNFVMTCYQVFFWKGLPHGRAR